MHGSEAPLTDRVDNHHVTAKVDGMRPSASHGTRSAWVVDRPTVISSFLSDRTRASHHGVVPVERSFATLPVPSGRVHPHAAATPKG